MINEDPTSNYTGRQHDAADGKSRTSHFTCPDSGCPRRHRDKAPLGWHYLSNATCLIQPHLFHALFIVSRITINYQTNCSPLLKNTCVRQVVLDKWFPLNLSMPRVAASRDTRSLHASAPLLWLCGIWRSSASQRHNLSRGPVAAVSWILDLPFFSRQRRSPWGWSEPTDERWGYERLAEHC